jgi:hypothetical protein
MTFAAVLILTCVFALLPAGRARTLSASEAQAKPRLELDLGRHGYRTEDKFAFLGYSGDDTIVFVWLTYRESLWKTNCRPLRTCCPSTRKRERCWVRQPGRYFRIRCGPSR